LPEFWFIL